MGGPRLVGFMENIKKEESNEKPVDTRPVAVQLRMYEWEALLRLKGITSVTRKRMESQIGK